LYARQFQHFNQLRRRTLPEEAGALSMMQFKILVMAAGLLEYISMLSDTQSGS
jgi:hypothetical protein